MERSEAADCCQRSMKLGVEGATSKSFHKELGVASVRVLKEAKLITPIMCAVVIRSSPLILRCLVAAIRE